VAGRGATTTASSSDSDEGDALHLDEATTLLLVDGDLISPSLAIPSINNKNISSNTTTDGGDKGATGQGAGIKVPPGPRSAAARTRGDGRKWRGSITQQTQLHPPPAQVPQSV